MWLAKDNRLLNPKSSYEIPCNTFRWNSFIFANSFQESLLAKLLIQFLVGYNLVTPPWNGFRISCFLYTFQLMLGYLLFCCLQALLDTLFQGFYQLVTNILSMGLSLVFIIGVHLAHQGLTGNWWKKKNQGFTVRWKTKNDWPLTAKELIFQEAFNFPWTFLICYQHLSQHIAFTFTPLWRGFLSLS